MHRPSFLNLSQSITVVKDLIKDGSKISDWGKYKTLKTKMPTGQPIEVHFYKNKITGEVNYTHRDYKVKGKVRGVPKRPDPEPKYKPAPYGR